MYILYLCIIFRVPLYGEGSYRQCLLPNPYYVLFIIKLCLNNKKNYSFLQQHGLKITYGLLCCKQQSANGQEYGSSDAVA